MATGAVRAGDDVNLGALPSKHEVFLGRTLIYRVVVDKHGFYR